MTIPPLESAVASIHILRLAALLKRWQVTEADLLTGIVPSVDVLSIPQSMLSVSTVVALTERARALSGEPGLGIFTGLDARASSHGFLGFAAMSAATLGDALRLVVRYAAIRTTAFSFRLELDATRAVLTVDEHADFGSVRDVMLFSVMVSFWQMANSLTERELALELEFALPRPDYFARFAHVLPPARFDQPINRITGPRSALDARLVMANPEALELARRECEDKLVELGLDGRLAPRVRAALGRGLSAFGNLDSVAAELGLTGRTLRRRLEAEGAPFATLLASARRERAQLWLRSHELSVEDVAERLGYSNVGSFTRAFTRWTGQTPSGFRKSCPRP
ncbi:MAG TPA: AraC family transcriptional regulator ligand-binding domain-containing protein [Polyangiales bacterium]|nr:AraC family transcriptional regulator ligand-binding domain-containing protein [Polyangiales bacterium]